MKTEPDMDSYLRQFEANYEKLNYSNNLSSRVLDHSHKVLENMFSSSDHFSDVLEIGAGSGKHLDSIRHGYDRYVMSDGNPKMLDQAKQRHNDNNRISFEVADARELHFEDKSFDRVIATHVLEHLINPHDILREWARVIKPGGTLSLVLPCDPGFAWRLGRNLGVRQRAQSAGMEYDYWMAREHVNSIYNLVTFINYYFEDVKTTWWPMRLPLADINLIYAANIRV
ncbi:MAG: class I SAM-dependent methyltransferase [Rhizobiaceae bacterium]|nr:class I SAM-dependent methyltransferase [Rhizobiaceae bacterium]